MPRTSSSTPRSPSSSAGSRAGGSRAASSSSRTKKRRSSVPPEPSLRAVAYVRESTEEQGQGFSPDAQREAIRTFAAEHNLELTGEYCDFHSGWKRADGRPQFQQLMVDAAERRFDCVLVYHTSRFARNQVEARHYKQMLRERLGIKVLSVTQPLGEDHSDPSAFLAESIHEMFDEDYSVSLSFWTRTGMREKARQGHLVGALPWGYVRDPETKIAVPDSQKAPFVRELFERYAGGQETDRSRAAWLNAKGARSCTGRAARARPSAATSARRADMATAATNRSPAPSHSKNSSSSGSPDSAATNSCARRFLPRFEAPRASRTTTPRDDASWSDSSSACATSTSWPTSRRASTCSAGRRSKKSCRGRGRRSTRDSTRPTSYSTTSAVCGRSKTTPRRGDGCSRRSSTASGKTAAQSSPLSQEKPSCATSKRPRNWPGAANESAVSKAGATGPSTRERHRIEIRC